MNPASRRRHVWLKCLVSLRSTTVFWRISAGVCCLVLLCTLACWDSEAAVRPAEAKQVRGHVVEVIARNITEIESLRIRDDAGRELTFTSEGFVGFTPSHLKEHQLFGQSVLVFYVEKGGRLIVVDITD